MVNVLWGKTTGWSRELAGRDAAVKFECPHVSEFEVISLKEKIQSISSITIFPLFLLLSSFYRILFCIFVLFPCFSLNDDWWTSTFLPIKIFQSGQELWIFSSDPLKQSGKLDSGWKWEETNQKPRANQEKTHENTMPLLFFALGNLGNSDLYPCWHLLKKLLLQPLQDKTSILEYYALMLLAI